MSCLDKDYPFLLDYFTNGIKNPNKNIAHCILLWGTDIDAQYELATEIARLLNCKFDGKPDCNCLNCQWIKEQNHPAVLTYSPLKNKPSKDDHKTVISIEQAHAIKDSLTVTSDYYRVFILCDGDEEKGWGGLNNKNFQDDAVNSLLKTFEEPPENTTFIFLTNNVTDVISTVVSRCQCFYVPSKKILDESFDLVKDAIENYLEIERDDVLEFNDKILNLVKNNEPELIFTQIQNYIISLIKVNLNNKKLYFKLLNDIKAVEKAKQEYKVDMQPATIVENLGFDLILK